MQGDVAAAAPIQPLDDASFRPKSSLMKKLSSFLLHPKKNKSKSASPSQQKPAPSMPQPPTGPGSTELELLFAQAEATLGELLVRAGASFEAASASSSHTDPHHHKPASSVSNRSQVEESVSALFVGGTSTAGSRSANFSGHASRRSLGRVWQQLGGTLFCGSGHMKAYVMDQDTLAPEPAPAPSKGFYEDVDLDEAYWHSVADAMLLEQQRHQPGTKIAAANDTLGGEDERSCQASTKEVQNDRQQASKQYNATESLYVAEEEEDRESEIIPSMEAESVQAKQPMPSPLCGSSGRSSLQDMDYTNLVGAEPSGGACMRLNTTLDESPNLAHNYFVLKVGGTSSKSQRDTGEAMHAMAQSCSSSVQPVESFLWQGVAGPSSLMSGSTSSPSSRSAPDLLTSQEPAGVDTSATTSRVSLMALLHEEAAAGEPTTTLDSRGEEEEEEAAASAVLPEEEERRSTRPRRSMSMQITAGEDPLQCCVCMSRRKGAALIPCGHTFCRTCAKHLFAGRGACPLCNNLIVQVLDIF